MYRQRQHKTRRSVCSNSILLCTWL